MVQLYRGQDGKFHPQDNTELDEKLSRFPHEIITREGMTHKDYDTNASLLLS